MLELIDLDQAISKEDYDKQFPLLERELGECQRLARAAGVPVIVVFEGWDASGKGTIINRLTQAIDPRGFKVHPILPPNETERFHPWMWRFWNKLPAAGDWAIFDRSWYRHVLEDYLEETIGSAGGLAGPGGHPPVRAGACRQRRGDRQVLAAHQQARTEEAISASFSTAGPRPGRSARPNAGSTGTTTSGCRPSRR